MTKKNIGGNEAIALGALRAGVKVATGYPGTPSSEVITSLLAMGDLEETKVEWSTNEKVAFEVAAAAAWAGHRALCTMKMSGLNVAYDSVIHIAYSGCTGALVLYVTDDPGVSAGMAEQDSRGFALMSDMPMLEPSSVAESYEMIQFAFELSEAIQSPVFVRSTTNISQSHAVVEVEPRVKPAKDKPVFEKNISQYTKAGAMICMVQHQQLIDRLAHAGRIIEAKGVNKLSLVGEKGGLGVISMGAINCFMAEGFALASQMGVAVDGISTLSTICTIPFPLTEVRALLNHCAMVLILEELEPHLEKAVYLEAYKLGVKVRIVGKEDGTLSRIGDYNASHIVKGLFAAAGMTLPADFDPDRSAEKLCAARPIGRLCRLPPSRHLHGDQQSDQKPGL